MPTMTGGHLGEDALVDLLEDGGTAEARAHAAACLHCRARLDQAVSGLQLARDADIPEPSPRFWESFPNQVDRRIQAGDTVPAWKRMVVNPWLAVAAALLVAVAVLRPGTPVPQPAPATGAVLPAWSALPAADEDPGLELLAAVVPDAGGADLLGGCQGLGDCMSEAAGLSEEESVALTEALRRELGSRS